MPRLNGRLITCAPAAVAISTVRSVEPSDTTTTSSPGSTSWISASTRPMFRSSLKAGRTATRRTAASGARAAGPAETSSVDMHAHLPADDLEQSSRAVPVGVLVEDALARPAAELLRLRGVVEELAVRGDRLVRRGDDEELRAGLEPALDPL